MGFSEKEGRWAGDVDDYFLVGASLGYKMNNGLSIDINSTNLTDIIYRSFPRILAQRRLVFINWKYDINHNIMKF